MFLCGYRGVSNGGKLILIHQPRLDYSGLSIVMSNPSRLDKKALLSGTGGMFFVNECLYPTGINRYQCEIRTMDEKQAWLPNTRIILALGEEAFQSLTGATTSLNEQRGSPLITRADNIPLIASYLPQIAVDKKNYEAVYNVQGQHTPIESNTTSESGISEKKRHGITNQKNFRFWLQKDTEKVVQWITNQQACKTYEANYNIYPDSNAIINSLLSKRDCFLYFDIETDISLNITCFSFAWSLDEVFVVPVISCEYAHAYCNLPAIFRALAISISRNILVCHNGSGFDYLVLGHKYRIAINKVYDTLLAQNRIFPGMEKSLGHCISLPWMWESYHKDEGNFAYGNREQAMQLWKYCGKDVSSLILLHQAQTAYAKRKIGLTESIRAVNSYVKSYVTTTLMGIRYDQKKVEEIWATNDRLMIQYLRILRILIGEKWLKKIRGTGKSSMPGSSPQCCRYFHDLLKYPVIAHTEMKRPKLDKKAIFKLKLKFANPVLDVVIAYRKLAKESGSLKFIPYKT